MIIFDHADKSVAGEQISIQTIVGILSKTIINWMIVVNVFFKKYG